MTDNKPEPAVQIPAVFYATAAGNVPVLDWLKELPAEERRAIGLDLQRVQFRWPVGMPLCRALGHGIWEVRTTLPTRIARLLLCFHDGQIVILHGFIKKTQKTPDDDFDLAIRRKKEIENGE